jgi:predicted O-methyltransferase YrrM
MRKFSIIPKSPPPARYAFHPWATHLPVLCRILDKYQPKRILELGAGDFSTVVFNSYVAGESARRCLTLENNPEWLTALSWMENPQHSLRQVKDWESPEPDFFDLVLIDQAPEESRKLSLLQYAQSAGIVVLHDAQWSVRYAEHFTAYQYHVQDARYEMQTAVLSNHVDVTVLFSEAEAQSCH